MQPASHTLPTESEAALEALVVRRDQLKELVALEARREEHHHHHPGVKKEAALLQKQLAAHLEKIEAQIQELLAAAAEVRARVERLTSVAGVGTISACTLLAYLPELGELPRTAIAALAGVAPMNKGQRSGARPAPHPRRAGSRAQGPLHGRALLDLA